MSPRKYIIGGNWKCNTTLEKAKQIATDVSGFCEGEMKNVEVVVFPPSCYLHPVGEILKSKGGKVALGAQDFHVKGGAFTGSISVEMLKDLGVEYVLVGHSERRHVFGDVDVMVNAKLRVALDAGLKVVLCIGEKLEQRDGNQTEAINAGQLQYGLAGVKKEEMKNIVIAYEPVWAIGTGRTATPEQAEDAQRLVRAELEHMYGKEIADDMTIQYGGSMNAKNCDGLLAKPNVDGGLIGGASLKAEFAAIIEGAKKQ